MKRIMRSSVIALTACAALLMGGAGCRDDDDDEVGGDEVDFVFSSGNAMVRGTFTFDLDRGTGGTQAVPAGHTEDFFWRRINATDSALTPRNGARFSALGIRDFSSLRKSEVETMPLSPNPIAHTALPVGAVVAYRTDEGRFGKLRVRGYGTNQNMDLTWITWE